MTNWAMGYDQLSHAQAKCFGVFLFSFFKSVYFGGAFDQAIFPVGLDMR